MSSAATNILHQPTYTTLSIRSSNLKSSNPSLFLPFCTKKPGRLVSRTVTEMVKTSSFRNSTSSSDVEEDVRVLEQEAFIDGSSQVAAAQLESTLNRLSKWIVAASFGGVIIWRHDAEALWALMGSVVNAILSVTLKRILNQERPVSTSRSDPGMPSSHAQSIFFIVTYIILSVEEALGLSGATFAISGLAMACGSYLSWLRVSQQLHTISQVAVGAAVGFTFSTLWLLVWHAFVLEAYLSNLWVRIIVVLGAAGFCLGFAVYVIRNWFRDER
ncbi:hypothetical protein Pint_28332 [Pistacia integerrima]|uniref:Uncharacterized protein n=1 Tax=Pistacia integerrima TaxID=434235 RepID=A0ACC0YRJ0_9ROSI|nr:hypothetical protein Pint_28332 [Pistacia integerrima]